MTVRSGSPAYELREHLANTAAQARRAEFARGIACLSLELATGDTRMVAENRQRLAGPRSGVPADWRVTKAEHRIDERSYTCQLIAELTAGREAQNDR